ncbi:unnamed protein product [Rhodiola kirilowii]
MPRNAGLCFVASLLRKIAFFFLNQKESEKAQILSSGCSISQLSFSLVTSASMIFRLPNTSLGLDIAEHSKKTFLELQRKRSYRYASLPENDCRYAVYDYDFVTIENCQKSKIFFIAWSPDTSGIRAKMLYAASKEMIKSGLNGIHYEIQATDPTEMDLQVLQGRAH